MIHRKRLIATVIIGVGVIIACDNQRSTSPTAPAAASLSASASGLSRSSSKAPRQMGKVQVTKECSQFHRQAGQYCTITSSNLDAIKVGMRVIYATAATPTMLDSDLTLQDPSSGKDIAYGHVWPDLQTLRGVVVFWGGRGTLNGFHAGVVVTHLTGANWSWEGAYSSKDGNDDTD